MQRAMDRLSGWVRRHRTLVLVVWGVLLLASLPFASRQTENLTGGGFEVPGTGSVAVEEQIDNFEGAGSETLAVVLEGDDPAAAVGRVREAVASVDGVSLPGEVAATGDPVVVPLQFDGGRDEALDAAK